MAQNPLLGSRISLVSKKNIRYEGTLYSINETNATVALQNVRSFGTEGREAADPRTTFVAPQDAVHPYLLFRGCDIKDLHVHERASAEPPTDDPAVVSNGAATSSEDGAAAPAQPSIPPPQPETTNKSAASTSSAPPKPASSKASEKNEKENQGQSQQQQQQQQQRPKQQNNKGGRGAGNNNNNRRPRKPNPASQVGTGASLLNRKARGTVEGGTGPEMNNEDFDFQTKLDEFNKEEEDEDDDAGDSPDVGGSYEKDDFFDSISCDALDRQSGVDNRLRGAHERSLNTETFGAVALNSQRRRRRGGGRGYGGRGGRGRGRGRGRGGRGRGRGRGRNNGRGAWGFNDNNTAPQAAAS